MNYVFLYSEMCLCLFLNVSLGIFPQWMCWITVHLLQRDFCDMVLRQFIMEHSIQNNSGKWRAPPASHDDTPLPFGRMTRVLTRPRNPTDPDTKI